MISKEKTLKNRTTQDSYQAGFTKAIAHQLVLSQATSHLTDIFRPRALTLPGTSYLFEHTLLSLYPDTDLVCLEEDPQAYAAGRRKRKAFDFDFDLRYQADLDYWSSEKVQPFDLIWLDYCGPWCKSKMTSMDQIFERRWMRFTTGHNPWLGITLLEGLDMASFQDFLYMVPKFEIGRSSRRSTLVRVGGIGRGINALANAHGQSAELKVIYRYRDRSRDNRARPMLLFLFEIHNKRREFDVWKAVGIDLMQDFVKTFTKDYL